MRILMSCDTIGGVWTYAIELAAALKCEGVHVTLATMGRQLTSDQQQQLKHRNINAYTSTFALEWMNEPWDDVQAAGNWLVQLADELNVDVVHLNGYTHAAWPFGCPRLLVAHSCVYSWWRAVRASDPPPTWEAYRRKVRQGLHAADAAIAPTYAMRDLLQSCYGRSRPIQVIHNGIAPERLSPEPKQPYIFTAGRIWDPAKNIAALNRIADQLDWPIYAAGEATDPQTGRTTPLRLRTLGRLDATAMQQWLAPAAIFALPAWYEPFGLCPLEAALAGCALVLGNIPSLREIWGQAALYVPPNDPHAIRDTINTLSRDPTQRRLLAQRARARALQYTSRAMARQYHAAYRRMLGQPAPRPQPRHTSHATP